MTGVSTDAEMPTLPVAGVPRVVLPDERVIEQHAPPPYVVLPPGDGETPAETDAGLDEEPPVDPEWYRQFVAGVFVAFAAVFGALLGYDLAGQTGLYASLFVIFAVLGALLAY